MNAGLRPEARLLLDALAVDEAAPARLRDDAHGDLDWGWIAQRADTSRVVPSLLAALRAAQVEPPPEVAEAFESRALGARLRHMAHVGELVALTRSLAQREAALLAYKGPALAELLYDEPGMREYTDLDVIVDEGDLPAARALLAERGWRPQVERDAAELARHVRRDCEEVFEHAPSGMLLELHWRLLPRAHPQGMDVATLRERAVVLRRAGVELRVFEPVDLLLALCLHAGLKHRWMRLQMALDVAHFLARHTDLDVDELERRALAADLDVELRVGVCAAWLWLGAPAPSSLLARGLEDHVVRARLASVRARLFRAGRGLPGFREWQAYVLDDAARARARGREVRSPGRAAYLLETAAPEWADRQSLPLPRGLRFLHWGWRPLRLWGKHGRGLFERLRD